MFAMTRKPTSMILGVALLAGAAFHTSAFAADATLASNEHAAQSAIVGGNEIRTAVPAETSSPSLARSEALAQRVIVDVSAPATYRDASISEATLTHNEIAAQRSIVDATAADRSVRDAATVANRVVSMRSPNAR
jgi:hypothetical protein